MAPWEFVVKLDREHDLTDREKATRLLPAFKLGPDAAFNYHVERLNVLRSLVRRIRPELECKEPGAGMSPERADEVLREVLQGVRLDYRKIPDGKEPLSEDNFDGLKVEFKFEAEPDYVLTAGNWHVVLQSFVWPLAVPPVCPKCGIKLPDSPQGKRNRAKQCGRCRRAASEARRKHDPKRKEKEAAARRDRRYRKWERDSAKTLPLTKPTTRTKR